MGGTTLSGDENDPGEYWSQSQSDLNAPGNALQYISEVAWNDTSSTYGLLAGSGGASLYFGLPAWQAGLISNQTGRMVPDIAFAASPYHDGYLVCSQSDTTTEYGTDCANDSFWSSNPPGYIGQNVYGGTSASAQAFGGLLTLMVQAQGTGYGLGNINSTLYNLAANPSNYAAVFHDITTGNNLVPCNPSLQGAPDPGCVNGETGYTAQTGYDMTTGLGSINGEALCTALFGPCAGSAATTTALQQPNPVALNGSTSLTATVTSTTPGTITGTVTFTLGTTTLGQTAVTGGSATLNVAVTAANGFAVGANTIVAAYGGNAGYAGSSGSAQLTVTSTSAAATTTALVQPNPVPLNESMPLTATVTSTTAGTITGTVTFTLGTTTLGQTAVTGGSATLNVAVTAANGFAVGANTIVATYGGNTSYAGSSGSAQLTVTSAIVPSYTLIASSTSVPASPSGVYNVALTLTSNNYAGTVTLTPTVASANGTASNVTAPLATSQYTLAGGQTITPIALAITAGPNAVNHRPMLPWQSGGAAAFGVVLLGAPLTLRNRRALAALLTAAAIALAGFSMACSSGSGSSPVAAARVYIVTVTASGSGVVTNPPPVTITVMVN